MTATRFETPERVAVDTGPSTQMPAPFWVKLASRLIRSLPLGRYRVINWVSRRPRSTFITRMPADLGGLLFVCDLRDAICREVCFAGRYEPLETALLQKLVHQGMTFVDVGANWGYFSLQASRSVGTTGHVISLEPDPRMAAVLRTNISCNALVNITMKEIAAAESSGEKVFAGYDEAGGNFGVSRLAVTSAKEGPQFQALSQSLDSVMDESGIEKVDFVKIDVEGAEDLVIAGMKAGIQQGRYRIILLELHPSLLRERGKSVEDVTAALLQAGYQGWIIDHSKGAIREAAYRREIDLSRFLKPFAAGSALDSWPHTLWTRPGTELKIN